MGAPSSGRAPTSAVMKSDRGLAMSGTVSGMIPFCASIGFRLMVTHRFYLPKLGILLGSLVLVGLRILDLLLHMSGEVL